MMDEDERPREKIRTPPRENLVRRHENQWNVVEGMKRKGRRLKAMRSKEEFGSF